MAVEIDKELFQDKRLKELRRECIRGVLAELIYVKMLATFGSWRVRLKGNKDYTHQIARAIDEPQTRVSDALVQLERCNLISDLNDRGFSFAEIEHVRFRG